MANDRGTKGDLGRRIAQKALMPVVATAASAVAGYVAKKGPDFFEQTVLPKLKEARNGAGGVAEAQPSRAKSAVGSVGDLAGDLTDRAKHVVGGNDQPKRDESISQADLKRHIEERANARAERRKSASRR
jgi:hypothetical protein